MRTEQGYSASSNLSLGRAKIKAHTLGFRIGEEGMTHTCKHLVSDMLSSVKESFWSGVRQGERLRDIKRG